MRDSTFKKYDYLDPNNIFKLKELIKDDKFIEIVNMELNQKFGQSTVPIKETVSLNQLNQDKQKELQVVGDVVIEEIQQEESEY